MAEQKSRIYSLPEVTEINDDMYLMLDASDTGARRFNLKTFYDKVDGVQASADAANTAATAAAAAVDSANQAAQQAASAAESATTTVQGLVEDVNEALEAVGDISEQAVPTMSPTVKGGAKLGTGLEVVNDALSVNTTASGDGSQAGPILSLSAKGWAEQDTTTGKNLFPRIATTTAYGVTFTLCSDGSVALSGTTTSADVFSEIVSQTLAAGMYRLSGATGNNVRLRVGYENGTLIGHDDGSSFSFTLESQATVKLAIRITADNFNVSGIVIKPQLELGSTATAYEPYTGGAPSPNPDYPQEIKVARGRNLYNGAIHAGTKPTNPVITPVDGVYTSNITLTTENIAISTDTIVLEGGKTYTFSILMKSSVARRYSLQLRDFSTGSDVGVSGSQIINRPDSWTALSYTFTPASDMSAAFMRVYYAAGSATTFQMKEVQLEEGPAPTPYVPYGYVGLEAQGKNLLNRVYAYGSPHTYNGITFTVNNDKSVTVKGTATAGSSYLLYDVNWHPPIESGVVYTASGGKGVSSVRLQFWSNVTEGVHDGSYKTATFTVTEQMTNWNIALVVSNGVTVNTTVYPQLELGGTATPYEMPYYFTTPIPLPSRGWVASLPDGTADTLTLDGAGKVVWNKTCNEAVLDGSETINFAQDLGNCYRVQFWNGNIKDCLKQDNIVNVMCSKLPTIGRSGWTEDVSHVFVDGRSALSVNCFVPNVNSQDDAVAAMVGATVLYPLATPVAEERGYIEMSSVPVGASISIPELDELGVKYCVDASALEMARMWYEKAKSEYAEELMELRVTVNELATRIN